MTGIELIGMISVLVRKVRKRKGTAFEVDSGWWVRVGY